MAPLRPPRHSQPCALLPPLLLAGEVSAAKNQQLPLWPASPQQPHPLCSVARHPAECLTRDTVPRVPRVRGTPCSKSECGRVLWEQSWAWGPLPER